MKIKDLNYEQETITVTGGSAYARINDFGCFHILIVLGVCLYDSIYQGWATLLTSRATFQTT
jgi:hypothetical protein